MNIGKKFMRYFIFSFAHKMGYYRNMETNKSLSDTNVLCGKHGRVWPGITIQFG